MTFWDWLDRRWPTERGWVTLALFALISGLLLMALDNPALWDVEVFKVIIQAVVLTGFLNMLLAFYFAANKADEAKVENTNAAFRAIEATAKAGNDPAPDVLLKPGETAKAIPDEPEGDPR